MKEKIKMTSKLFGVCTITLTPFDDNGNIDEESLRKLTNFYIDSGVHGMTILGIMGESHKLSENERLRVTDIVMEETRGRVPVIVGCTSRGTDVSAMLARKAEEAGAAGVMIAAPAGLKNEDMLFKHYEEIAKQISIPIVIQDEPVTTGVIMSPQFLARLNKEIPNCQYVKLEEAPTTVKTTKILELTGDRLGVFGGLGGMYLYEELDRGAIGIMTGFAYPEVLVETYKRFSNGDKSGAREYFYHYLPLIRFEAQLGIGGVTIRKEIFQMRDIIKSAHVRFPGAVVDQRTVDEVKELIEYVGLTTVNS